MAPALFGAIWIAVAPLPPWIRVVEAAALAEPRVTVEVLAAPVTPLPMATVVLLAPLAFAMLIVLATALLPMPIVPAAPVWSWMAVAPVPP